MNGRGFLTILTILILLWVVGLFIFVGQIEMMVEPAIGPAMEKTDAIVVLTGGSDRVPTGVALLDAGKGKKLFISGVHAGLTLDHVLGTQPVTKDLRNCCIALGYMAESTRGNADETHTWLVLEDYHSLRLVTANYHMLRSMLLFQDAMPEMKIIPHPVAPDSVKLDMWWSRPGTASLLITEYNKYLWAFARQWINTHLHPAPQPNSMVENSNDE